MGLEMKIETGLNPIDRNSQKAVRCTAPSAETLFAAHPKSSMTTSKTHKAKRIKIN